MTWHKDQRINQWAGVGHYILRSREREQWTTVVHHRAGGNGSRRVTRWGPWRTLARLTGPKAAADAPEAQRRRGGISDIAIFHGGHRLEPTQLAQLVSNATAPLGAPSSISDPASKEGKP